MHRPLLPLPEPLRGRESGTFTEHSIVDRLPDIGRRTLAENDFSPSVTAALESLMAEIPAGPLRPLTDVEAPDAADWNVYLAEYAGQNWLNPPWFFVETYFYRRVVEATGYFGPDVGRGNDPFAHQKQKGLEAASAAIGELAGRLMAVKEPDREAIGDLVSVALWGNQVDLSLWPAEAGEKPDHDAQEDRQAHTLVDDTEAVLDVIFTARRPTIDFLVDNAGFELVADLALAAGLLAAGVPTVRLQLKIHPTFVSDATAADVRQTIESLKVDQRPAVAAWGEVLAEHLAAGRLRLKDHPFWTSPLPGWEMPADLYADLADSGLIVVKGDANYRRLLGDRHWAFTAPLDGILNYRPAPLLLLRTLKSEVAAGLATGLPEQIAAQDPEWLTNGRWGVIQYQS